MTKYGRPDSVAPASSTRAMLAWSIMARACRSASKRAMTCRVSMPGLMTLRATLRCTGRALLGHVDGAHAALADLLQQLVRADDRAGLLADLPACPRCTRAREEAHRAALATPRGSSTARVRAAEARDPPRMSLRRTRPALAGSFCPVRRERSPQHLERARSWRHVLRVSCPPTVRNRQTNHPTDRGEFWRILQPPGSGASFFSSAWSHARA